MTSVVPYTRVEERPEKILPRHLEQTAIVYIRQSSLQQVHRNQESTKLQYSLVGVAQELGWARDRVVVIDDDLGVSGSSAVGREGFQRVLSEVALDHVGLIVGVEMSRLARSNKDWHQLLELCARFGTLIADLDGLYDPSRYNDRLLLGLKGTMSEAELHILRQRLMQGKLQKARRGELVTPVPTGYLRLPTCDVVLDPDEEVQASVRAVFDGFVRVGSTHGVLGELVPKGSRLGSGDVPALTAGSWSGIAPISGMIAGMLRNPIYAGAYAYGRRRIDRTEAPAGATREWSNRTVAAGTVARPGPGSAAGVHHLGSVPAEPGAPGAEPGSTFENRGVSKRTFLTAGARDMRQVRLPNAGAVRSGREWEDVPALRM